MPPNLKKDLPGKHVALGVGDFKVGREGEIIETVLGCCVGVCLYDKNKKVGSLLHFMLPAAPQKEPAKMAKYADTGLREMLRVLRQQYRVKKADLTAKVFGGAKMLPRSTLQIGRDNSQKIRELLNQHKIPILKEKMGGARGYKIRFDTSTGTVYCQVYGQKEKKY